MKQLLKLFLMFFKIGAFTFGGGYAMISIIKNEFTEKHNYMTEDEFFSIVAVSESTPGPVAINMATYVGYKLKGFWGSFFATLGVVLPSFIIIYAISLFFDAFLKFELVQKAFKGIQCAVGVLIFTAGVKMIIKVKKPLPIVMLVLTMLATIAIDVFALDFSTIFIILIGGAVGLVAFVLSDVKSKRKQLGVADKADGGAAENTELAGKEDKQ